ncbi:Smlt3025 familytype IV secretion system inhibitor [Xanthomonas campestris]|uniref:Smlt3025 familytype IV secretion system inhibitor n=1 Tax=Xanthomonas campestris TaxID=339 RepID=UPI003558BC5C
MHMMSSGRCLALALAVAVAVAGSACARTPSPEQKRTSPMSGTVTTGRTINGHTYSDAPVDVKLGPNTFRIPANYLDSQIAPWSIEVVTLVIEWPDMTPTPPGARANPRTNDFRKEIHASMNYVDRVPIEGLLARYSSNEALTEPDSVERGDPVDRLDLRIAQPETLGLTPYAIDEEKMAVYVKAYEAHYDKPPTRNPAFEDDWYVARDSSGNLTTFIKCDSVKFRKDGIRLEGDQVIDEEEEVVAGCTHHLVDVENKLSITLNYHRAFLRDWKRMEKAIRDVLARTKVG